MKSRRQFIANSARLAAGGLILPAISSKNRSFLKSGVSPADQVNIAAIGVNGMGWADTTSMIKIPGVNLLAICDVDKNVIDKRMNDLQKLKVDTSKIKTYGDYRQVLDRKDIDAVIIGTPDHWH